MLNGLYVAAGGMMMQSQRVDVITANLSNVMSTGYKKERPAFTEYMPQDKQGYPQNKIRESEYNKTINATVKLDEIQTDFTMGNYRQTGNEFDFAIGQENAFFAVDTPFGVRFTRDGSFTLNEDKELVTQDGFKVLSGRLESVSGVNIQPEDEVVFSEKGEIFVNGTVAQSLFVGEFEEMDKLQKVGRNLFVAVGTEPEIAENPRLKQGFLEASNVNAVEEMVKMLEASRGYETYQKVIQTMDDLNSKTVNDVGRLG